MSIILNTIQNSIIENFVHERDVLPLPMISSNFRKKSSVTGRYFKLLIDADEDLNVLYAQAVGENIYLFKRYDSSDLRSVELVDRIGKQFLTAYIDEVSGNLKFEMLNSRSYKLLDNYEYFGNKVFNLTAGRVFRLSKFIFDMEAECNKIHRAGYVCFTLYNEIKTITNISAPIFCSDLSHLMNLQAQRYISIDSMNSFLKEADSYGNNFK